MLQLARHLAGSCEKVPKSSRFRKIQKTLRYEDTSKKDYLSLHFQILVFQPMISTQQPCCFHSCKIYLHREISMKLT